MKYFWVRAVDGTVHIAAQEGGDWWVPGLGFPVPINPEQVVAACEPPPCTAPTTTLTTPVADPVITIAAPVIADLVAVSSRSTVPYYGRA